MERIRLKAVALDVDFRQSELTNYKDFVKRTGVELARKGEAILLVSGSENQLVFVLSMSDITSTHGTECSVLDTRRLRLTRSTWNPLMLQNYANERGLHLEGFRRFEEVIQERKRAREQGK